VGVADSSWPRSIAPQPAEWARGANRDADFGRVRSFVSDGLMGALVGGDGPLDGFVAFNTF
jgi:hypothetical protein